MDLFVVPTIGFELLYAFVIVRLDRRDLIWIDVTRHPTAEWIARQITEAFPWNEAPRYLIRDRVKSYQIDGRLLHSDAANFSVSGLKGQIVIESVVSLHWIENMKTCAPRIMNSCCDWQIA